MNRGRTSVTFPEKAYLFGTTQERTSPGESLLVRTIQEKTHQGASLPPSEKALILRNREGGGPPFLSGLYVD